MIWASSPGDRSLRSKGHATPRIRGRGPSHTGTTYEVLGPLAARRDGEPCPLGGRRQRLVLAILLANGNRVLSRDALIDAVWAEDPPAAARTSLHTYVSHLRDALGPSQIDSSDGGYRVRTSPETFDALQFEAMVVKGRSVADSDPRAAAGIFDRALRLWKGSPFGDLGDWPALVTERERLSELRLSCLEDRIDVYLALNRHAEVVAEVPALLVECPYRERFYEQLMLGLYRSGRHAEALRVFGNARRRLAEDLGVDPSPQLWALENQILSHDPALLDAMRSTASAVVPQPAGHGPMLAPGRSGDPPWLTRRGLVALVAGLGVSMIALSSLVIGERPGFGAPVGLTQAGCLSAPADLTAWWTGDEKASDLIGGREARLVHGSTFGPGRVGEAFVFDGQSFVDVDHDPTLDPGTGDFTVDLWARFDSTVGEQVLVEKWVQTWSSGESMGWTFTKLADDSLGFFSEDRGSALGVRTSPQEIPLDTWTHFAARRRGSTAEILVNGDLVASQASPGGSRVRIGSVASLKLGHRGSLYDTSGSLDDRGFYMWGSIDEVHLSVGSAASDDQIRHLVAAGGYCRG